MTSPGRGPIQLELPLLFGAAAPAPTERRAPTPAPVPPAPPRLRVIQGGGERKREALKSRDSVVRVLIEAGADLLLRRISPARAEEIEQNVERALSLFDQVDRTPALMPVLQRHLDDLEDLMTQTRARV